MLEGQKSEGLQPTYEAEQAVWDHTDWQFTETVRNGANFPPVYMGEYDDVETEDFLLGDILRTQTKGNEANKHSWPRIDHSPDEYQALWTP